MGVMGQAPLIMFPYHLKRNLRLGFMKERKKSKQPDDYYVNFKGAKLNPLESNRVGVGIIFALLGIVISFFLPIEAKSIFSYCLIAIFFSVGYFIIAPRIFKKK